MQKRKYSRIDYQSYVDVMFGEERYRTVSEDLSLRGIKIKKINTMQLLPDSSITLNLKSGRGIAEIDGRIAFSYDSSWGIVFTRIGEKSLNQLVSLLKENAPDSAIIHNEYNQMILRVCD